MKKQLLSAIAFGCLAFYGKSQTTIFEETITLPTGYVLDSVLMPPSPLSLQVLFVGGVDIVETTKTYGNPAGKAVAKEWHDFIGFTPDNTNQSLGWVSVNHEMIYRDDRIGDGGGMTAFRLKRAANGELEIVEQTLADGRNGKFFNVDFVNTVGETGMNCGGIVSPVDGRIWTAEEWFRSNNKSANDGNVSTSIFPLRVGGTTNQGVRDTADYTIKSDIPGFDSLKIKKYQNFNYMVEIDPREAKAIRKQYNWGRQGFEGGTITMDNKTVYLGIDDTPSFWVKFVADTPGDFTKGKTYVYKHDAVNKWIEIDNTDPAKMLNFKAEAVAAKATMYNREEWVAIDKATGKIYWTETGADRVDNLWADEAAQGAVYDPAHVARATAQGLASPGDATYRDYYGRVWVFDPAMDTNYVLIEGGPDFATSPAEADYPSVHLSNPDGLNVMEIDGRSFLVILEDLNGTSAGRTPAGVANPTCEMFLLDLTIKNPTLNDLIRISAVPSGAEITGAVQTPDGKSLLVNSQHPRTSNPFPYNHSLTYAIHGFDKIMITGLQEPVLEKNNELVVYPNPTNRLVYLNQITDVALYNIEGKRLGVYRNTDRIDVSNLPKGMYFIQTADKQVKKLVIE